MNPKELEHDKKYLYTGGPEPIEVTYLYETINRYMFDKNGEKFSLSVVSVKINIEEICQTAKLRFDQTK
ncbi:hypothetical protein [Dysgonomonas termitidis]|uniref:Uncharacterized protein n=1 Tax=Dysgonomonas termitidis TaxID=1516126 RepID=A0ABV9KWL9_9BACT